MIAFGMPAGYEWFIIGGVMVLLFGHRLPGIARSMGSTITSFKRGLKQGEDELDKVKEDIRDEEA